MKLSLRLFLGYFFLVAVSGMLVLSLVYKQISPGVRTAMEASLVDAANLLAEVAAPELSASRIQQGAFAQAVQRYSKRPVSARIFDFPKQSLDYRVYVTDAKGIVQFDSADKALGKDFSHWNDVRLTLQGQYGARSTHENPTDERTVMHVAAPIRSGDQIIGVLTVAYPTELIQPIIERSKLVIQQGAWWLFGGALAFGALFTWRLTRAIDLLVSYARKVTSGHKTTPPRIRSPELATLAQALESMREQLEGKQYVERYVQTLTHEMKSPLAAIRGAAELLDDELPPTERQRFASNVREQAERLDQLIERLLGLAALEQRQHLVDPKPFNLTALTQRVMADKATVCSQHEIQLELTAPEVLMISGEVFLIQQAVSNLLDNAIDFSPNHGVIEIELSSDQLQAVVAIRDDGPGIPDYALSRLFERFYSLPRPRHGRKSTGLGLAFVQEIAELHSGKICIGNAQDGGTCAVLQLKI